METRIANNLMYRGNQLANMPVDFHRLNQIQDTPEMLAKRQAEQESYKLREEACLMVEIAEKLVLTHNLIVADAFEKAKELYAESKMFVDNYKK